MQQDPVSTRLQHQPVSGLAETVRATPVDLEYQPYGRHEFKKYENSLGSISFEAISYRRDESNFKIIKNVKEVEQAKENLADDGTIWSDLRVYLNRIKDNREKRTYNGCPSCKKGVQPDDTSCSHCQKSFDKPRARYILPIELSDYSGSLWATAYDEFA